MAIRNFVLPSGLLTAPSQSPAATSASVLLPVLLLAGSRCTLCPARKLKKDVEPKKMFITKEELEERRKDTSRIKPFGLTAWKPVDDVYVARYYPKPIIEPEIAVEMLKTFQRLEFTNPDQDVHLQLQLDMKLEKKNKLNPFVGYVHFPFPFVKERNKICVFTENAEEIELAKNSGAAVVGGTELIPEILNDVVQADFYIATPEIASKLTILKNKLRKKFPKNKRGSVGNDIANMIKQFEASYEYIVERECIVRTKIATLDMPLEQIIANMDALLKNVCEYKPLNLGPFVENAILTSATSEALYIDFQKFLPQEPVKSED
ncbi:PREDICTED: 39S ribosomal protein L1, mitochondrial [Nanorana parkeri]|uniref:39S ribosomal protein L1, mitochondrial n=1 Tax=Nanorana parkeri TaxID=125878 RepID=UPI0008546972|nr:PREDICTED: 39S ribosomal protein L1, mitochondrial [Nanorana parkeri]